MTVEGTRETAVKAAEEAGWGKNGGGRVLIMSEERDWMLKAVEKNGHLSNNLIDESNRLPWQKIEDQHELENSLVVLIYSSGTTGLPKGKQKLREPIILQRYPYTDPFCRRETLS